ITTLSTEEMAQLFKDLHTEVLVWSAGAGGVGGPERTYAIDRDAAIRSMEAAQQAGIRRYIMVSYLGAGTEHGVPADNPFFAYAESKAEADQHLRGTRLEYTILGPGMLTTEDEGGISVGVDPVYHSDLISHTPRATVARVLAEVVDDSSTIGKGIPFTGGDTEIRQALAQAPSSSQLREGLPDAPAPAEYGCAPSLFMGSGRVFLSRKVGSRTGVRDVWYLSPFLRAVALLSCQVCPRSVRVLSRDEFRVGYSVGAASLGILKPGIFRATAGGSRGILRSLRRQNPGRARRGSAHRLRSRQGSGGGVPMVVCRGRQAAGIERIRRKPG
ncbi:MAG: NAD(P)H-binding protein, partial [Rothia dentocariosa]